MKDLQLSNGEKLPTLEQYLKRAKKLKNVRLILELKAHETPERNREAVKAVVDMVKRMKLAKRTVTYLLIWMLVKNLSVYVRNLRFLI